MRFVYLIMFLAFSISTYTQEVVTGLYTNPVVAERSQEFLNTRNINQGEDTIPVFLPFRDDFSQNSVFPSPERWIDREAFVNTDFPVYPINIGVVTLDAINDSGNLYQNAIPGPSTFIADHLTSRFIRLDSVFDPTPRELSPGDSVYLSFYYQPQGRGLTLNTADSLSLEFLIRESFDTIQGEDTVTIPAKWQYIWASSGMNLDTFYFYGNKWFRRVMIPIKDQKFFKKNFQFRFYNHVSLASNSQPSWQSNADPWHIDEVYLNVDRSQGDTVFPEIRFIERPPSMLENYTAMPYKQYSDDPGTEMADTISFLLTNRDIVPHITNYKYAVTQLTGTFFAAYQSPEFNLPTYTLTNFGYNLRSPLNFVFPISSVDSSLFIVTHTIKDITDPELRDTVETQQSFYNYYSYDDGTPEQGYGLKGINGKLAYRFRLNVSPDTLRAVRIYFNKTLASENDQYFYLTVWNDNNDKPGDTIYSSFVKVNYSDQLNNFYTYNLDYPVRISGAFYIGTVQTTDENLNIGFDSYNNAAGNILFNVTGVWQPSVMSGALMIRPVVGKPLPLGLEDIPEIPEGSISIYPNPCFSGFVRINSNLINNSYNNDEWDVLITNVMGMLMSESPLTAEIDVSSFRSGMYILTLRNHSTGGRYSSKLIISK